MFRISLCSFALIVCLGGVPSMAIAQISTDTDIHAQDIRSNDSDLFALPDEKKPSLAEAMKTASDRAKEARENRIAAEAKAAAVKVIADKTENLSSSPNRSDDSDLFALPDTKKPSLAEAMKTVSDEAKEAREKRIAAEKKADAAEKRADAAKKKADAVKRIADKTEDLSNQD